MLYHLELPSWLPQLQRISGGDPRWLVEMIRAQVEAGLPPCLVTVDDQEELADLRLKSLVPESRRLLGLLACARGSIPPSALEQWYPGGERLSELVTHGLVDLVPSGLRIAGPRLQRTVVESLTREELSLLHRQLGPVQE